MYLNLHLFCRTADQNYLHPSPTPNIQVLAAAQRTSTGDQRSHCFGFSPGSWEFGVDLGFGDFDVQFWDFYCRELNKILSVILTDDLRPQIYNDQTNVIVTF